MLTITLKELKLDIFKYATKDLFHMISQLKLLFKSLLKKRIIMSLLILESKNQFGESVNYMYLRLLMSNTISALNHYNSSISNKETSSSRLIMDQLRRLLVILTSMFNNAMLLPNNLFNQLLVDIKRYLNNSDSFNDDLGKIGIWNFLNNILILTYKSYNGKKY